MNTQFKRKWLNWFSNLKLSPWKRAGSSKFVGQQRQDSYYGRFCLILVLDFCDLRRCILLEQVIQLVGIIGVKSQSCRCSVKRRGRVMTCVVGVTVILIILTLPERPSPPPDIVHQRFQDCAKAFQHAHAQATPLSVLESVIGYFQSYIENVVRFPTILDAHNNTVSGGLLNCFLVALKSAKYRSPVITTTPRFFQPDNEKKLKSLPVISPHNPEYLVDAATACLSHNVRTLFVSPSAPHFYARRQKVRKSNRGTFVKDFNNNSTLLFFIGLPSVDNTTLIENLKTEAQSYGDVVLVNAEDKYKNILTKALAMLRWTVDFCPSARYVIRTDDDVNVTVADLISVMENMSKSHQDFIVGKKMVGDIPARSGNKWHLSVAEFPGSTLPTYVLGGLIGYPMTTVQLLYEATLRLKSIWLDDVYITGMCSDTLNIPVLNDTRFVFEHYVNPDDYKPRGPLWKPRGLRGDRKHVAESAVVKKKRAKEQFEAFLRRKRSRGPRRRFGR